jgi:cytochrome c biogenesis protein CcmG/thiol:disulfide interchange protein DsbE
MTTEIPETETTTEEQQDYRRPRWGRILVWVGLIALLVLLALGLQRSRQGPITVGDKVPNFSLTTFEGQTIELDDLAGKVVVLNFWASWCYESQGEVVFLGVDYVDTETEAQGYLEKFAITYPNGPDLGTRISQAFRIRGVPETYFIGKDGILRYVQIGPFSSLAQIKATIEPLLAD